MSRPGAATPPPPKLGPGKACCKTPYTLYITICFALSILYTSYAVFRFTHHLYERGRWSIVKFGLSNHCHRWRSAPGPNGRADRRLDWLSWRTAAANAVAINVFGSYTWRPGTRTRDDDNRWRDPVVWYYSIIVL